MNSSALSIKAVRYKRPHKDVVAYLYLSNGVTLTLWKRRSVPRDDPPNYMNYWVSITEEDVKKILHAYTLEDLLTKAHKIFISGEEVRCITIIP